VLFDVPAAGKPEDPAGLDTVRRDLGIVQLQAEAEAAGDAEGDRRAEDQ
jgi:hypothetical protein